MSEDTGFARFENMNQCTLEMGKLGHSSEDAAKICGAIRDRAEKGILYKATCDHLEVLSKADDADIYLGGNFSWEIKDDEGDIITVDAQVKGLTRFMNQLPEWQSITINHKEFKLAMPVLKVPGNNTVFTHVHEKGGYLISKLRNDNLKTTQYYREEAKKGNLDGYSLTGIPLERDPNNPKIITDIELHSVTITQKGVMKPINPMSRNVKLISKADCECDTEQCGAACCTFITMPLSVDTPDVKAYLDLHGLTYKADGCGGLYVKMPVQCKAFDPLSKLCTAHDRRPDVCKAYPRAESPFIEKAKCSLLQKKQGIVTINKGEAKTPSLNSEKTVKVQNMEKATEEEIKTKILALKARQQLLQDILWGSTDAKVKEASPLGWQQPEKEIVKEVIPEALRQQLQNELNLLWTEISAYEEALRQKIIAANKGLATSKALDIEAILAKHGF